MHSRDPSELCLFSSSPCRHAMVKSKTGPGGGEPPSGKKPKTAGTGGGVAGEVVPVATPSVPEPANTASPQKPSLPAAADTDVDVLPLIRGVIAWVKHNLRQRLKDDFSSAFPDASLYMHGPLEIKDSGTDTELLSYKHPWKEEAAMSSLKTTDMYEAGGNLFWANPFPLDKEEAVLAGETPSWHTIREMAEAMRMKPGASSPGSSSVAKAHRIIFPVTLTVHAPSMTDFKGRAFPSNLRVVTGHAAIYAWFLAMFEALDSPNPVPHRQDGNSWVAALWQAALTVTFQAHVVSSKHDLAILSMTKNNDLMLGAKHLVDSFPAFARKLAVCLTGIVGAQKRLEHCQLKKICYDGKPVQRTLLTAACMYVERIDDETHNAFMKLERRFGKDAFTSKYNNLNRVVQLCAKEMDTAARMWDSASTPVLVRHIVFYIMWLLEHEKMAASSMTQEWLDKSRDGSPGCVVKVLAKMQLILQMKALATELPEDSPTRKDTMTVLANFTNYEVFSKSFEATDNEEEDPFKKLRAGLGKTAQQVLDFLFDIFDEKFDTDLTLLCKKANGPIGHIQWSELEGDAGKAYRDITRQMGINKQTVSMEDGAPPTSTRSLQRTMSCASSPGDETEDARKAEMQAERVSAWRSAQQTRKKYALVSTCKFGSEKDIQSWFEKQKTAHSYVGKPAEQHRIFVFSADCFGPESDEPWQKTNGCGKELAYILDFLKHQNGPYDVVLAFDGRHYDDRRVMEPVMRGLRHLCEVWVTYQPSKRLGKRAVAWASETREIGWISLPVSRTMIPAKTRLGMAAQWGASTHESNYSKVPQVPWDGLPQISATDKAKVMAPCLNAGAELPRAPDRIFNSDRGTPLYWQEVKPVALWEDLLFSLDGKMVVDLSPGSGSCGRACLRLGIEYVAACRTDAHASWLANVLDRESCELIVTGNSPLFEQDLGALLKAHFQDVLDMLIDQKKAKDNEPEEE